MSDVSPDISLISPFVESVSHGILHFGIQEAVEQGYRESLAAEQYGANNGKNVASNALWRSRKHN